MKHVQRQYFSFTKTTIESKVSLKIMSQVSISLYMFEAGVPVFALFQDELEARKSLRAFCLQPKSQLNILRNLYFEFAVKKYLKGF